MLADNPDDVVGILLAKDLLPLAISSKKTKFNMRDLCVPPRRIFDLCAPRVNPNGHGHGRGWGN